MQKSVRLFALAAVLSLSVAPSLHAEQMGTNPHPQVAHSTSGVWGSFLSSVRGYFGLN